jgi:hypothetical protein
MESIYGTTRLRLGERTHKSPMELPQGEERRRKKEKEGSVSYFA